MFDDIIKFLNSPFFTSLVTLIVGTFAYGVYTRSKQDAKRRAATVILLEIEEAEQQATKVSIDNPFPIADASQIKLMPVSSWNQYKHLFADDFDPRESDKISDFYTRCEEYDKAAELNADITFERNQHELRNNMQRVLAEYAKDYTMH